MAGRTMLEIPRTSASRLRYAALLLAIATIYFLAAKLGLSLAVITRQVTAVWPPTGIAIAAVLIFGYRVWPAILVGAFLVNAVSFEPLGTAFGIGVGNTLEAVTGVYLLRRFTRFGEAFARPRDAFSFITLPALLATTVAAAIGATSLCLGGVMSWHVLRSRGVGVVGRRCARRARDRAAHPELEGRRGPRATPGALTEAAGLMTGLIVVGLLMFASPHLTSQPTYPVTYTVFPFILWAAYRFGMRGATTTTFVISLVALWGTVHGNGPFATGAMSQNLVMLQLFMAVVAVTGLVFGAMSTERIRAERELRHAYGRMEARVVDRTAELERTNSALMAVIDQHQRTLDQLRRRDRQFAEAQATAHIGSWEWDTATDTVTWSDELYRLYGLEPQSMRVNFAEFLRRVHEDDREPLRTRGGEGARRGFPVRPRPPRRVARREHPLGARRGPRPAGRGRGCDRHGRHGAGHRPAQGARGGAPRAPRTSSRCGCRSAPRRWPARTARSTRRTGRRTSSWPRWRTSCGTRWRRSATRSRPCATTKSACPISRGCAPSSSARSRTWCA